jgi:hypothetical protein
MNSTNVNNAPAAAADFEARMDRALEHKLESRIPVDFAVRVAARAVAQPLKRRRYKTPQFGKLMALLSIPVAAVALFALAPHAVPNVKNLSFDAEVVLLAELALIGGWIARLTARQSISR